jgi:probable FeS assembly SUF system protein SufT
MNRFRPKNEFYGFAEQEREFPMSASTPVALTRECDAIEIPSGTRQTLPSGTHVRIVHSRGGSYTIATDAGSMCRVDATDADALGLSVPPAAQSLPAGPLTEQMVNDQLKAIFDPEIPVNIVDLGLVYSCRIEPRDDGGNRIDVKMAMTAPGCGMGNVLKADVESKLSRLPDVKEIHVDIVFDPPWHAGLMSEAAKLQLGLDLGGGDNTFPIFQEKH